MFYFFFTDQGKKNKIHTRKTHVFQLNTTYTTNNYHYNADVTNLEIHNKKASTCTTQKKKKKNRKTTCTLVWVKNTKVMPQMPHYLSFS